MKNKSAIVGIDVGKKGAYVVCDVESRIFFKKQILSFDTSLLDIYKHFEALIETLHAEGYGNILFIVGEAFGMRRTVKKHSKFYGVIEMLCEEKSIQLNYESDSTCRAAVLGKGNGRNKAMVHIKFKGETPDISDSMLFVEYQLTQLINEDHNPRDR